MKKIIDDVHGPSPAASPSHSEQDESIAGVRLTAYESSDPGCEDEVTYTEEQHEYGDEASDGYADEDKSMDLSDEDVSAQEHKVKPEVQEQRGISSDDDEEYVWTDGDTNEDIMNVPGKTAPPAQQQDLIGVHIYDEAMSEEKKSVKQRRAAIEETLKVQRVEHESKQLEVKETGVYLRAAEHEDDTNDCSYDAEIRALEAVQAETGMSSLAEEMGGIELEDIEPSTRRQTQIFSPKSTSHRTRSKHEPPIPAPDFSDARPAVMQTPRGKHLDFTSSAAVHDTPFSKTLSYFKQHRGKENSPSKSRRNASLPEEIAQLAKEANDQEIAQLVEETKDEEDLEKYREMDLAPMEPLLEDESTEDLITLNTPAKVNPFTVGPQGTLLDLSEQNAKDTEDSNDEMSDFVQVFEANTVGNLVDTCSVPAAEQSCLLFSEHDSDSGADADRSESTSNEGDRQLTLVPEHPTFIKVIEMLPEAMILQIRASMAHYSNRAYEALVDKLHGLGL